MLLSDRKILFWIFVFLFLIIGSAIIFYSLGWRIDFDDFKIQKVGAVSIKTEPKNVIIKIDGEIFSDKSGIFQSETLVKNLTPGNYEVEISKPGYNAFKKIIEINPSKVSKLSTIRLIPEILTPVFISSAKGETIAASALNENRLVIKNEKNVFYLYNLNNLSSAFNLNAAIENKKFGSKIKKVDFVPFKTSQLIIETDLAFVLIDSISGQLETIPVKPLVWTISNSSIFMAVKSPKNGLIELGSYNLIFKTYSVIFQLPKAVSKKTFTEIKSSPQGDKFGFIDLKGNLYLRGGAADMEEIAHSAKFFSFSPDGKKVAFLDKDGKINVYFFGEPGADTPRKTGDVSRFKFPGKENIASVQWYWDSEHLFIDFGNGLEFAEIDQKPELNIQQIYSGAADFFYEPKLNVLFLIGENKLQKINFNEF